MAEKSKKSPVEKIAHSQEMGARKNILEEIFNDYYKSRRNIYFMNFFRGLFFGFGSVLGGTVVIAVLVWLLAQFVDWFPVLGDFVNGIINSMKKTD